MGKTKLRLSTIEQRVGGVSLMLLLLLLFVLFCPVSYQDTQAEEAEPLSSTGHASIALAISEAPALNITPTASGQFDQTTAQVKVTTSSNNGYKLYLGTADATNAMYSTDNSKTARINALAEPVATTDFLANTWGYALVSSSDNTNALQYQAVPESATVVADSPQAAGEYELNFGVKLDTALPAGQYINNVMISAIANPTTVTGLMSLTYMQDMTSNICQDTKAANGANTVTPGNEVEKRLIDVRDGKEYWVAKLADGNCWMTQNLAYDLVKGKVLTPSDTDVTSDWVVPVGTFYSVSNPIPANKDTEGSYNLGEYVFVTPRTAKLCKTQNANVSQYIPENNAAFPYVSLSGDETLDVCENFQNVADWRPTFVAQPGAWRGEKVDVVAAKLDENGKSGEYDAHYLAGNYYQFNALAAGTADSTVLSPEAAWNDANKLVDAKSSICPKGWVLPKAGTNLIDSYPAERDKSWYGLLKTYGYGVDEVEYTNHQEGKFAEVHNQDLVKTPFYFTRSGNLSLADGQLRNVGVRVRYWSLTGTAVNTMAFSAALDGNTIGPSAQASRGSGFAIRCVAR